MRLRAIAGFSAFTALWLMASASGASPGQDAQRGVTSLTRAGESRPWIYQGMPAGIAAGVKGEARARAILAAVAPHAARAELAHVGDARFDGGDTILRFEQTHRGLPVIGRGATVTMDANGDAKMSVVRIAEDLPASIVPRVDAAQAARAAQAHVRVLTGERDASLVVWTGIDGGARLAWVLLPRVPAGFGAPRIVVDAETARVIEVRDMATYAKASVFETNPIASPNASMKDLPIGVTADRLENAFVKSQNCLDKKSVRDVSFVGFAFKVHICDLDQLARPDGSGDFVATPSDEAGKPESRSDAFSEVSMYYHATKAYSFFRTLQGDPTAQVVVEKPLRTISNLQIADGIAQQDFTKAANPDLPLQPFQNAFYSPAGGGLGQIFEQLYGFSEGAMWFGQGPKRDYSYDGDVVYHEFTHGVVNATLQLGAWHLDKRGAVDSPGAMNEGLADYFSSALAGDPKVGEYASKDISSTLDVIRTLDNKDGCPAKVTGEVHYDSTLFSGGLWEARTKIPAADQAKFDAALYKAMRAHPNDGNLGYEDLAQLFVTQLNTDFPAGAKALTDALTGRGVLPGCERILEVTTDAAKAPGGEGAIGGFASPGKQTLGSSGDLAPGIVQVHTKLAPNTVKAKITFTAKAQSAGGGGIFGGGGKPFAPVVIVKANQAITWTTKGKLAHDGDAALDPTAAGSSYTAELDVAAGSTDLYVQIANKGDTDGTYDSIAIKTEQGPAPPDDNGNKPPTNGNPPGAGNNDSSGCSCTTTGAGGTGGGVALGLGAALGLALVLRRRKPR